MELVRRVAGQAAEKRLEQRVASMGTHELTDWAENAIGGVGRAFGDWTRSGEPNGLDEARLGTAALLTVLEELNARRTSRRL
jgi:hypothetical protein